MGNKTESEMRIP